MHQELEALLVVQSHDERIRDIEQQKASVEPRRASLDNARRRVEDEAQRTEKTLEKETERYRALESRIAEHKIRHEKNLAILNQAQRLKEATAAAAQVEAARRVLADEESELLALGRRLADLRSAATATREALAALADEQATERAALDEEAAGVDAQVAEERVRRDEAAKAVPFPVLNRYERIYRHRHAQVVFALRNFSCGNCDTAIPLQRRPAMSVSNQIEMCEGCGVLLYLDASVVTPTGAESGAASESA